MQSSLHKLVLVVAAAAIFAVLPASAVSSVRVDTNTGLFRCTVTNRTMIFHGVNAVYKVPPYIPLRSGFDPDNSLSAEDIEIMQGLGFNAVRLGVMWPGVEPQQGEFNLSYLAAMNDLVNDMGQNGGIFSIVDFHQDLLHPSLCGEGIPDFALRVTSSNCTANKLEKLLHIFGLCKAIKDYHMPVDPSTGYPETSACLQHPFGLFYPSPDVSSAFQSIYEDADLQGWWAGYWQQVAATFSNNSYVLGMDLFNEPWAGNVWENLKQMEPGYTDLHYLQPLYQLAHQAIRKVDNDHIIFYEGTQVPDVLPILNGLVFHNGFTASPGGSAYDDRQGLSYHVYCCGAGLPCDLNGDPSNYTACDAYDATKINYRVADAMRVNRGGAFLTEFGGCSSGPDCIAEINRVAKVADENFQSWTYWQYKYFHDVTTSSNEVESLFYANGTMQEAKVKALSRTYAQAIQGVPLNMFFDPNTAEFELTFEADSSIKAPTVIYLNQKLYYPNGVTYSPSSAVLSDNTLTVPPQPSGIVTVTITPD